MDPNALGGVSPTRAMPRYTASGLILLARAEMKGGRPSQRRRFTARLSIEKMT